MLCYMESFKVECTYVEHKVKSGIFSVSTKRSEYDCILKDVVSSWDLIQMFLE